MADVILIQEHWLMLDYLNQLHVVSDKFVCFTTSAMSKRIELEILRGRPSGGVAILVNKSFAQQASFVFGNDRVIVVKIGQTYFVNVYFPDSSVDNRDIILSEMCSFMEQFDCVADSVIIGDDFNSQFVNGLCASPDINDFIAANSLTVYDSKFTG